MRVSDASKLTIAMRNTVREYLETGEYARWTATIILLDGEHKTYGVWMDIDSTFSEDKLTGYSREIGAEEAGTCTVEHNENSLGMATTLEGLQDAEEIQQCLLAKSEKSSNSELAATEIDTAPDEGLVTTILEKS